MSDTTKHRGQQSSRRLHGPDLPFYFSTEDLRILLRKPTRDAVRMWIKRRRLMVIHDQRTILVPKPELERVCPALVHGGTLPR
ncbi:MAG: hypothetical protein V3T24_03285 [Longimicrobiales bacterium]